MTIKESIRNELHFINNYLNFKYRNMSALTKELTGYIKIIDLMLFEEPEAIKEYTKEVMR